MALLPPLLLVAAALLCGPGRGRRIPVAAATGALALGVVGALTGGLAVVQAATQLFTLSVVLVVVCFSRRHLDGDPDQVRYDRWLLVTAGAAVLALSTGDLLVMTLAWVLTGVGVTALVGHHRGLEATDRAVAALRRARAVGDVALLVAVGVLVSHAGSTSVDQVRAWAAASSGSPALIVAGVALFVTSVARCGLLPLSRWVPLSVVAPAPVSALLHAGIINAPVLLLLQLAPVWQGSPVMPAVLCGLGLVTSVFTFPRLLVRADVKTRLAWSTTAQMGFVLALLAVGAHAAAVVHMALHGIYKAAAFLGAGDQLARARRDGPVVTTAQTRLFGAAAGLVLGSILLAADSGWMRPLTAVAVVIATTAAGAGLLSVRASFRVRLAAGAVVAAVTAGVLAAGHGAGHLLGLPLDADGPLAWTAAAVIAVLGVFGAVLRTRKPPLAWILLHRVADPVIRGRAWRRPWTARSDARWRPVPKRPCMRGPLESEIAVAAQAVPPAWDWQAFIATDPLLGEQHRSFDDAVAVASARGLAVLPGLKVAPTPGLTLSEELVAGWLAAWTCLGDVPWAAPRRDLGLWDWFRAVAARDPVLTRSARSWLQALPDEPLDVVSELIPLTADPVETLRAQLLRLPGWAGYLGRRGTVGAALDVSAMIELLAVQLATVHAVGGLGASPTTERTPGAAFSDISPATTLHHDVDAALVALAAREEVLHAELLDSLTVSAAAGPSGRRDADLVFCIDVRSEPLRRHLEAVADVRTVGFAGFFGLSVRREAADGRVSDRCPALLEPTARVSEAGPTRPGVPVLLTAALRSALDAPGGGFAAVDAAALTGLLAFVRILWPGMRRDPCTTVRELGSGADAPELVAAAVAAVRATGLHGPMTAEVVVLVGHGSTSTNNPAESAFDCGACGGSRGAFNARLTARVINSPAGRAALAREDLALPPDTVFLAAEHDTALDRVVLLEPSTVPLRLASKVAALRTALDAAAAMTANERCRSLPGGAKAARSLARSTRFVRRRALDAAEVRHEWGLVGNAFFIAAPRSLTAGLDLRGRAFLHDYHPWRDPDLAVLETILTAPLVVAHWINAQYFFSTCDSESLGAGSKTAHNPVGALGVVTGPGGDLRTGLAEQSVRYLGRAAFEPVRLLAVIAASPAAIDAVLARQPALAGLVTRGWLTMCTVDLHTGMQLVRSSTGWHPRSGETGSDRALSSLPISRAGGASMSGRLWSTEHR